MITIEKICDSINGLFGMAKKVSPKISEYLLACSLMNKPGLSTIVSASNVVKAMSKLGIPTGKNPDGTPNLIVATVIEVFDELFRALREDASVQTIITPGSMKFLGVGANAGGPMTVEGVNITPGDGWTQVK